jgi:hypothetical protein
MAYQIGDAVFVGDTLFMPDVGSARCDFPGGNAATLYQSGTAAAAAGRYPLVLCHDYPANGRCLGKHGGGTEQHNIHLHKVSVEADFIALRSTRCHAGDAAADPAGHPAEYPRRAPPAAESNGVAYLKIPLDML